MQKGLGLGFGGFGVPVAKKGLGLAFEIGQNSGQLFSCVCPKP